MEPYVPAPLPEEITNRKGPIRASEIRPEVIALLNSGQIETVNLTEWLAVDPIQLLRHIMFELDMQQHAGAMLSALAAVEGKPTMKVIPAVAAEWRITLGRLGQQQQADLTERLAAHRSDTVRCWAAYLVGIDELELDRRLALIRRFAADSHFGVREIAWMAVREPVARELQRAIALLRDWVWEDDANLRRFAVEVTRPRGVWAKHIAALKEHPEWGLPLLEPLKADRSKYVQDSVANWLNDAAKSRPEWVAQICREWLEASAEKATRRIAARAQRSIAPGSDR